MATRVSALRAGVLGGTSTRPAGDARHQWSRREVAVVAVTDTSGRSGLGEAAPLPGRSRESLVEVMDALATLAPRVRTDGERAIAMACRQGALLPSLAFALETACADLGAQQQGISLATRLGARADAVVEV